MFVDPGHQALFDRSGYCVLEFLDTRQVKELRSAFEEIGPELTTGFHATMYSPERAHRRQVYETLRPAVQAAVDRYLLGCKVRVANFVVKAANDSASKVDLHMDWSFVDETKFISLNVWCPLVDVDQANGCLWVLPGSERHATVPRAHRDPHPYQDLSDWIWNEALIPVPMRAGQGIFYHCGLLHGSRPNRTSQTRVAIGCVLAPADVPVLHYFRLNEAEVEVFSVTEEFFWTHVPGERPKEGACIGVVPSAPRQVTRDEVLSLKRHTT